MSNAAIHWSLQQQTGSPAKKLLLFVIADLADELHTCWPSIDYLCEKVEVSKRTLVTYLNDLEEGGFLRRERRYNGFGERKSNRYVLPVGLPMGFGTAENTVSAESAPNAEQAPFTLGADSAPNGKTPGHTVSADSAPNDHACTPLSANCCTYKETPHVMIYKSSLSGLDLESDAGTPEGVHEPAERVDKETLNQINIQLGQIQPSLSVESIRRRVKIADLDQVDVVRAAKTIISRTKRPISSYIALVAAGIDRSPEAWPVQHDDRAVDGDNVNSAKDTHSSGEREACARGEHDWGPTSWGESSRTHCVRAFCNSRREHDRHEQQHDLQGVNF